MVVLVVWVQTNHFPLFLNVHNSKLPYTQNMHNVRNNKLINNYNMKSFSLIYVIAKIALHSNIDFAQITSIEQESGSGLTFNYKLGDKKSYFIQLDTKGEVIRNTFLEVHVISTNKITGIE